MSILAKKKVDLGKNVKKQLVSSPQHLLNEVDSEIPLEYTRAVDTFVMEKIKDVPLRIDVMRDGKTLMGGNLLWASKEEDGSIALFLENKKYLYPTRENVKTAMFHRHKKKTQGTIEIEIYSKSAPCVICGKPVEIFDENASCPNCGAKSHALHLEEWVRMRGECSVCQAKLLINKAGEIITA